MIYSFILCINKIMREILFFLLVVSIISVTGCTNHIDQTEKPIGKGHLNLCISNPAQADFYQITGDVLWDSPDNRSSIGNREIVAILPACENLSVTIWGFQQEAGEWHRVTILTDDGRTLNGWMGASHLQQVSNETGTEWSEHYNAIVGRWYQTGRGNGSKIWYEFKPDGTFTFNYDMMGNRDTMQNQGSWTYLGNNTYQLISSISKEPDTHGNENITLQDGKSFQSGTEYSSASTAGRDIVYAKE
jgi:hypothetical protein